MGPKADVFRPTPYIRTYLIAVTKRANRSKGAKGPEEWRPPDEGYWCQCATDWTEVKVEWGLTMTQTETEAVIDMLDTCEEPVEVEAERAEDIAGTETSGQTTAEEATATPTLVPEPEPDVNTSVYESCIDMNVVFQEFVTQSLREQLGVSNHAFCSDKQLKGNRRIYLDGANRVKLEPDLTWW